MFDSKTILDNIFEDIGEFLKNKKNKPKVITKEWTISDLEIDEKTYKKCFAMAQKLGCFHMQFCGHIPKYTLKFSDKATNLQAGISLSIRKVKCISISEQYGLIMKNYMSKKIIYFSDTNEILLFDYSQKSGKARLMTYRDLTNEIFKYINNPIFHEIIYIFLYNICREENREFLSSIKDDLLSKKLALPKNISGLTKNFYIDKKGFLEQEYNYVSVNDLNKEPLLKSILIQKIEKTVPQEYVQKLWSTDLNNIDVYNIDFRKTKTIAKNLYKNFVLENIINKEKIDRKNKDTIKMYSKFIDNYMHMVEKCSKSRRYKMELNYNIDSLNSFVKTYKEARSRYITYSKENPSIVLEEWINDLIVE